MKIPNIHRLSKASQLSLLAIVILLGAVFFTVSSSLQTQSSSGHASGSIIYQSGNYYCYYFGVAISCVTPTPIKIIKAPTPTQTPSITICELFGGTIRCLTPTPITPRTTPVPTTAPTQPATTCIIHPSCGPGVACPQYIGVGNCPTPTVVPTSTQAPLPTATKTPVPTAIPTTQATTAPTQRPQPTATPVPGDTTVSVVVGLHGIGTAGDSANPNSDGNMSPLHPQRNITVFVFNSQNQQVADEQGTVTYNSSTGLFDGNVDLGSQLSTGLYTVKVQTSQYLRGLVPGIQSLTEGQTTTLPKVVLVAGDINGDNQINILDYNILMGCYSDLLPATDCNTQNNGLSDLNDDGAVNQFDYNLFLRELSNVGGD